VSAAASTAIVPAGTAGSATAITVQARDAFGNPLGASGGLVAISVSGANSATPVVVDNGDGTYATSYTPTVTGTDLVAIALGGAPVGASPYASVVNPGPVSAIASTATVPAGTAGSATPIAVQARDTFGNPLGASGGVVAIVVSGVNSATPLVSDVGDGTYTASYTPTLAGTDQVAITLDGSPIDGSPFTSVVSPGAVTDMSMHAGDNQSATVGTAVPESPTVRITDANGNPVPDESVTFTVTSGGGTVDPSSPVPTDGDGFAAVTSWTLGTTAGANTLTATAAGLTGSGAERRHLRAAARHPGARRKWQ
jgi:hypothetical protein